MNDTPVELFKALLAAQKDMPELQRNAINPHFKSKFISLDSLMEQILPILNKHHLVLLQTPGYTGEGEHMEPTLTTLIVHSETGQSVSSTMLIYIDKENPQGQGSAITYARRYSLMAILGLVADMDDDANAASTSSKSKAPRKAPPKQYNEAVASANAAPF